MSDGKGDSGGRRIGSRNRLLAASDRLLGSGEKMFPVRLERRKGLLLRVGTRRRSDLEEESDRNTKR